MKYRLSFFTVFFLLSFISAKKVYIEKYGAKGNGISDDSKALHAAVNSEYDTILFQKSKNYLISKKIILRSNKTFVGNNANILCSKKADTLFMVSQADDILFFEINFIASHNLLFPQTAFYLKNSKRVSFEKCNFSSIDMDKGFSLGIFCSYGCDDLTVKNCTFKNIKGTVSGSGYAIHLASSDRANISDNVFESVKGEGRHAIYLSEGTTSAKIRNNDISDYECGAISLYSMSHQKPVKHNVIENNKIVRGTHKFEFDASISVFQNCHHNTITGNVIENSGAYGILLSGDHSKIPESLCANNRIENNTVKNSKSIGIASWGAYYTTIVNNTVINANSENKYQDYPAIGIFDDVNQKGDNIGSKVIGNNVLDNENCKFGIKVWTSSKTSNIQVENNSSKKEILKRKN